MWKYELEAEMFFWVFIRLIHFGMTDEKWLVINPFLRKKCNKVREEHKMLFEDD